MTDSSKVKCYMCNNEATSKEHVPPLCLFPEAKDVKGINLRKELIKVPSCEVHNSQKSKDDEFLLIALTGAVCNNYTAYQLTKTKVNRAVRRKSQDFLGKVILKNMKSFSVKVIDETEYPVLVGKPDIQRFRNCFTHIAYGLYYHKFGHTFVGEINMIIGFLTYKDHNYQTLSEFIKKRFEYEKLRLEIEGYNPEVFTYQFCSPDENGLIGLKMVFYQGAEIFVSFKSTSVEEPYDLVSSLIEKGLKVKLDLDGESFIFNPEN